MDAQDVNQISSSIDSLEKGIKGVRDTLENFENDKISNLIKKAKTKEANESIICLDALGAMTCNGFPSDDQYPIPFEST